MHDYDYDYDYNYDYDYDPNDVTPQEWQDQRRVKENGYYNVGYSNNRGMYNDRSGYYQDDGLYDPTNGEGSWYDGDMRDSRNGRLRQWNDNRYSNNRYNNNGYSNNRYDYDREEYNRRFSYIDRIEGPARPVRNWWNNLRYGFKNVEEVKGVVASYKDNGIPLEYVCVANMPGATL